MHEDALVANTMLAINFVSFSHVSTQNRFRCFPQTDRAVIVARERFQLVSLLKKHWQNIKVCRRPV
jgi:hypothetical protein